MRNGNENIKNTKKITTKGIKEATKLNIPSVSLNIVATSKVQRLSIASPNPPEGSKVSTINENNVFHTSDPIATNSVTTSLNP
ncbi:MAG: hypothetical protein ACW980_24745 [Promethearchaeota archaeon]|jgi:hypothetical protein